MTIPTITHLNAEKISAMDIQQLAELHDALVSQGIEEKCEGTPPECILAGIINMFDTITEWNIRRALTSTPQAKNENEFPDIPYMVLHDVQNMHGTNWVITIVD